MNSRIGRMIAVVLIQCQFSMMLPAQELRTDLRRGMARLEHYLDRAAAERRAQTWEQLAQAGLEAAMYEWESGALWLLEQDGESWRRERERAELSYRKETEAAYIRWASERLYNEQAGFAGSDLEALLREAAAAWNYGSSGRIVSLAGAEGARRAWERTAGELVDRYLESWEEQQGLVYVELEDRFRNLDLSGEEREELIRAVAEERRAVINQEYGRIALAEENRLMVELLYDQGSMKQLAADEAAAVIVRELANEAEAAAGERTRELFAALDAAFSAKDEEGIAVAAEDWLNQFRRAFEEGLARWEEAELGFLAARAEWEHEAEDAYLAGEETWNKAYMELTERQKAWEAAILKKLDEGFAKWQESQSRLSAEIETARNEFIAASEENRKVKEKMLDSQAEIYIRSRQMMDIVSQGIESWYDQWNEKYLKVYTLTKTAANGNTIWEWLGIGNEEFPAEDLADLDVDIYKSFFGGNFDIDELSDPNKDNIDLLRNQIELLKKSFLALSERGWSLPSSAGEFMAGAEDMLDEETGWLSLALKYREYADTAAGRLYRLAGSVGGHIEGYSGELRTELIKSEALLSYWDDELEVAEALSQYAQETGSVIEDSARTRKELESAGAAYDTAVKNYEKMTGLVAEKDLILNKAQDRFVEAQTALADLRGAVEEAQRDYANVLAAAQEMNPAPIFNELVNLARRILDFWEGNLESGGDDEGAKTMGESLLDYYRLSFDYTNILRSMEISALLETLESGAGLGQPGIGELESRAEETRLISQSTGEEELRAAAGLYPAEIVVSISWGDTPGEIPLYSNGGELLIALDLLYRESASPEEQEILSALMREIWEEASRWYTEEALLRKQSIEYLKTGNLPEADRNDPADAELRVRLGGFLAALRVLPSLMGPDQDPVVTPQGCADLEDLINDILSLPPKELAKAVEDAGEDPLLAGLMAGTLVMPAGAYAALWLAQRQAKRDLGLLDAERAQLIMSRYGAYDAKTINTQNRKARESVKALIDSFRDGTGGAAGRAGALRYAAELRNIGQGLNQTGQEALDLYIASFLEFAAVRDFHDNPENEYPLSVPREEFARAESLFGVYNSWQYKIYSAAGLDEIAKSGEFALLSAHIRVEFDQHASSLDYIALAEWTGKVIKTAYKEYMGKADAMTYAQYYQQEKNGSRFSWIDGLAAYGDRVSEYGVDNGILKEIDSLFTGDAIDLALQGLKNKTLTAGIWFTGENEWNYAQYREGGGESAAEPARAALEKGWNEYYEKTMMDNSLYVMMSIGLGRLQYVNKSGEELNVLIEEKKEALNNALEAYNTYLDNDYDLAVKVLDQSSRDYNAAVDRMDWYYREMAAARLHLRKRQEIYDWASSVYLKDFGVNNEENYLSPLEKLIQVRYARERAQAAVEVIKEILKDGYSYSRTGGAMESYKESRRNYYLAMVAAYEGESALDRQQAVVREAELAEESARAKLVVRADSVVPSDYELVSLISDGDGGYTAVLAYTLQEKYIEGIFGSHDPDRPEASRIVLGNTAVRKTDVEIDKEAFSKYFDDDKAVPVERVGAKEYITLAEYEAGEWLKRMAALGIGYYDDVMLASLYVRYCAEDGSAEGDAWFKGINDPRSGGNYSLGDIPLNYSITGFNLRAEYNSARREVLKDAYTRIMAGEGGEEDIARYLLYRGRNIISDAADHEENLLKVRSMALVERAAGETYRNYTVAVNVAVGLGVSLTATGTGLLAASFFNPGLLVLAGVAFAGAAASFATAAVLDHTRGQVDDIGNGIKSLIAGTNANLDSDSAYHAQFKNYYAKWQETLAYLSQERKVLNVMMYGSEEKPAGIEDDGTDKTPELSYENFCGGLSLILSTSPARISVSYDECAELYTRELFDKSEAKNGATIGGAIRILNSALDKEAAEWKEHLDAESEKLMAEQRRNMESYYAVMNTAMEIPEDRRAELRALALRAGDPSLDIAERRNARAEYERIIGKIYGKTDAFRGEIQALLKTALGNGSWNSEWYAANLIDIEGELFGSRTLYTRTAEPYTEQEIALLRAAVLAAEDENSVLALSAKEWEWSLRMKDFHAQFYSWREQVEQIRRTGLSEWEKARARMNEGYFNWQKNFADEYRKKTGEWDLNYLEFVNEKRQWIEDQYLYAVNVENAGLFDYADNDAARMAGQALARFSVERMNRETFDPSSYTDMLLEDSIMEDLLSRMSSLEGRGEFAGPRVQTAVKRTNFAADLAHASRILDQMNGDMRKAAAKLAVYDVQHIIDEAIRQFMIRLDSENKAMWEWEEHLVQANGYRTDGEIRRQAIVDSTAFETITRTQTVHRYQDYRPGSMPAAGVDLSPAAVQDLDADTIMRLVQTARWNLDKWGEMIFGRLDDDERVMEHLIPRGRGELDAAGYAAAASSEKARVNNLTARMEKLESKGFDSLTNDEKREYENLVNQLVSVRDGELGAHIGYGPILKDKVNYRHSPIDDALDLGAGEMGRIMLDFLWNSRVSAAGYTESFSALYDQKLWSEDSLPWMNAFTIRDVVGMAAGIGGMVNPLIGLVDDVIFAGFDLGLGYQSPETVLSSLAMNAAVSALSFGASAAGGLEVVKNLGMGALEPLTGLLGKESSNILFNALGSAARTYTGAAAMNAVRAFDFQTGNFDYQSFARSLYSTETLSGALGAFVGAGIGGLAGSVMSYPDQKLYGGLMNLAAAGYSEAARYGVYALDSMMHGSGGFADRLGQAYDNMGGVTLNIANLGSMLDLAGVMSYRLGENYHTGLGDLGRQLGGAGLLELNLGLGGASLSLGAGGIDLAGNLYSGVKHGLDYALLRYGSYGADGDRERLLRNYLYGDWAAENTSMRIGAGRDLLRIDTDGTLLPSGAYGYTSRLATGGGRLITIADTGNINNDALILQHESYRDGYMTSGNAAETVAAVLAHTQMTDRMLRNGMDLRINSTLVNDLTAYYGSSGDIASFARYALENYTTDGDFWKLTREGNLEYDGFATLRDEDGNIIISNRTMGLSDTAVESALLYILRINPKEGDKVAAVRNMMAAAGIVHSFDENPENWHWNGEHEVVDIKFNVLISSNPKDLVENSEFRLATEMPSGKMKIFLNYSKDIKKSDLTALNMGKIINLGSMLNLYNEIGAGENVVSGFINNTYGSAVDFLNYADAGGNTSIADAMISKYLDLNQMGMVKANQKFLNHLRTNHQNIVTSMFTGDVVETLEFGVISESIGLKRLKETDPYHLIETHPAIDVAGKGESITTPGGYWMFEGTNVYNAIFSLYGSSLRMRINHVNTDAITYKTNQIIGAGEKSVRLLDYPDTLYGTGNDTHVHVEYTLALPYNGVYTRQYVSPNTLLPSPDYLDYHLNYYDQDKKNIVTSIKYNRLF
ncbi:MAG: hypothetical protein LBH51_01025 [Treponema sp.]|nr:hypothetical protein [Treponema sp.]